MRLMYSVMAAWCCAYSAVVLQSMRRSCETPERKLKLEMRIVVHENYAKHVSDIEALAPLCWLQNSVTMSGA